MIPHPEAVKAAERSHERKMERAAMKAFVADAQADGVQFVEVHPQISPLTNRQPARRGSMTIAFLPHRRNLVEISTAICHPNDAFCKLTGRYVAADGMSEGRSIMLRKPSYITTSTKAWLKSMFYTYGE
jgi:hypothetical protein